MNLTHRELANVVAELGARLPGGHLSKLNAPGPNQLQLIFRGGIVWVEWTRGLARLHLIDEKVKAPPAPPAWVMKARAEIQGKRLAAVEQAPEDRIVLFRFSGQPDRALVVELFGAGRLLILDERDRVLAPLVGPAEPGRNYRPPAPPAVDPGPARFGNPDPDHLTVNRAVAAHYRAASQEQALSAAKRALAGRLKAAEKRLRRKANKMEADLERTRLADGLSRQAEALKYRLGSIRRGQTRAVLPDPFDPEGDPIEVGLDPTRSPQDNMRRMFSRARRLAAARGTITPRLNETKNQLEAVRELSARVAMSASPAELAALTAQVDLDKLAPGRAGRAASKNRPERRRAYRLYQSQSGTPILVGRSGKDNHQLTFRVARGGDLWLHARGAAGAHVVVRLERGREPDEQTFLDAATLAGLHSPFAGDAKVEVSYTRVKNVHAIKGANPGLVSMSDAKTLLVRMEPDRIQRLKDSAEKPA